MGTDSGAGRQRKRLFSFNPLSALRLAPENEFEGLIEDGFATDMFGWFAEAWLVMKANFAAIVISSIPAVAAAGISFFMYYAEAGRDSTAADALFGSYARTIIIMTLALFPSFAAMGSILKTMGPKADFVAGIRRLPGLVVITAASWAPLIFSGLMKEIGGPINWWAIPFALYLTVSYSFAPFLHVEAGIGAWQALETSRRTVSRNWFGIAALYAVFYPAAWVFSAAVSMIPGVFSTILVVDEMAKKTRMDPITIMLGISNIFMAGLAYLFMIFFQMALCTAYARIFRPVGYRKDATDD